mmetsp:Transcript_125597/g.355293  ORF Transcript_125597/g.355293 Transcript_125597/m.355293 type:complete len:312 (-) Transcript_125597:252-1187(-)
MALAVSFRPPAGDPSFTLHLQPRATVADAAFHAAARCGLEPEDTRLVFRGCLLDDSDTLESRRIQSGSVLDIQRASGDDGSTGPSPPSMRAGPAGAPRTSAAPGAARGGIDPAALMSLAALFAAAQGGGSGAQGPAVMQLLQHPALQRILQDPESMRGLAQGHPLAQLFSILQQQVGGAAGQDGGAGGGAPVPASVPGLSQALEALRSIIPGAGGSAGPAHGPGVPLVRAATQPLSAGAGAVADSGIPILGQLGSVVQDILGGITGERPGDGSYAAQVEQLVGMGFADRGANLRALRASGGSVSRAVNSLV